MSGADVFSHFQRLCEDLPVIREEVEALESPNPEDDRPVKFAIVGYSYHSPVESWGFEDFEFVARHRREVEDFDPLWVKFVCLAFGYLLGLCQEQQLNKAEISRFEVLLPGFMSLHSGRFTTISPE